MSLIIAVHKEYKIITIIISFAVKSYSRVIISITVSINFCFIVSINLLTLTFLLLHLNPIIIFIISVIDFSLYILTPLCFINSSSV